MMVDLCAYNIRGLNNKLSFVKDFINSNKLGLFALLETHVQSGASSSLSSFLAPHFDWVFNYDHHPIGRIWLGWDASRWNVILLHASAQQISCKVTSLSTNRSFFISVVYAFNMYIDRRALWNELASFNDSISIDDTSPP